MLKRRNQKVSKHEDVDKEESKTNEIQVKEENTTNKSDSKKNLFFLAQKNKILKVMILQRVM